MLSNLKCTWNDGFGKTKFSIDHPVIWYLTSFTTFLYLFCTCILVFKMMSGDAISCEPINNASMSNQLMEDYCLESGAFTLLEDQKPLESKQNSTNSYQSHETKNDWNVAPSVDFEQQSNQKKHHRYYGLVFFYLLVASLCCYFPKILWTHLENNRISNMCSK